MKGLEALCYLDDIAHGRKMSLDPHELKLVIEKELKALDLIKEKKINVPVIMFYLKQDCSYEKILHEYNTWAIEYTETYRVLFYEDINLLKEVLF